jgi:hypothetical protein
MMTGYKGAAIRDKAIIRDADLMRGRLLLAHRPGRSLHLPRNRRGERPRTMASPAGTHFPAGGKPLPMASPASRPLLERVQRAQSNARTSLSYGENRGSSPLGSANKIKYLLQDCQLVSNNCPINVYGQAWTLMMTMPYARCAGDCQRICTGQRCANKYPTLARAEIPTQHIFGVFNGRDVGPG